MTEQEVKNILERKGILDKLISIEIGGSTCLPHINNPRDEEIIAIVSDDVELPVHFSPEEPMVKICHSDVSIKDTIYAYISHFIIPMEGYERITRRYSILTAPNKHIQLAKSYIENKQELMGESVYSMKAWYHIYTTLCIIDNNSYELTEEQIVHINNLHDRIKDDEAINYCLNKLGLERIVSRVRREPKKKED